LRRQGLSDAPAAVVSANAFDKGLDNDVGITPADFITKPVRFDELLDWLGERLALHWLGRADLAAVGAGDHAAPFKQPLGPPVDQPVDQPMEPPVAPAVSACYPSRAQLLALAEVVGLGYPKGVQRALDQIDASHPDCAAWLAPLRVMAQQFSYERMKRVIQDALDKSQTA